MQRHTVIEIKNDETYTYCTEFLAMFERNNIFTIEETWFDVCYICPECEAKQERFDIKLKD